MIGTHHNGILMHEERVLALSAYEYYVFETAALEEQVSIPNRYALLGLVLRNAVLSCQYDVEEFLCDRLLPF